CVQGAHWPYSF
nr:immunoglobulin light chain junction region [Macaca mulatta]MOX52913.1 immunoglobulin light chain junction region [Macaca mulatta]MOX52978.1 immunoglobulin light chain junction region [Macaca mulatta]MOX53087.1 immunoglobulin light chain junction region [Macaca mulatta]MOX53554.1 immunoglobulin light chain junction region [Macaca mulatta]